MRKPFFKKSHNAWYVHHHGRLVRLDTDRDKAMLRWHELHTSAQPSAPSDSVATVLNCYLEWCQKNRSPRTYEWYRDFLSSFARTIGTRLPISSLKPLHVSQWLAKRSWNPTTRHNAVRAVKRVFNWAIREGRLSQNPLKTMERPRPLRREFYLSREQFEIVRSASSDQHFRDYMTFLFETGVRAQEIRLIEAHHLDAERGQIILPPSQSKGKEYPRLILLTDASREIAVRLAQRNSEGPIFCNSHGKPWTKCSINCRFRRVREKLAKAGTPLPGLCATSFRHGFATEALKNGVDPVTVSILMGHRDTTQVARTYQHLAADTKYLQSALNRFRGRDG